MGRPKLDLTNKRFGRLVALKPDSSKVTGTGKAIY